MSVRNAWLVSLGGGLVLLALTACLPAERDSQDTLASPTVSSTEPLVVVFSGTEGFRHDSIDAGRLALTEMGGQSNAFEVVLTEDEVVLQDHLGAADALVLLNTTGDVFGDQSEQAIQQFVEGGGGLVGIHAATDTEYGWPWYRDAIGAEFLSHPEVQDARLTVTAENPSTESLPPVRTFRDEWYNFTAPLPSDFLVLATVDETTYSPGRGAMGSHPVMWCRAGPGEGEVWYTALGHESEAYADDDFLRSLSGGITSVLDHSCASSPQ